MVIFDFFGHKIRMIKGFVGVRTIKRLIIFSVIICCSFLYTAEQLHYGSDLEWGYGARALGMGRAYVALADDASGLFWNPAGVMKLQSMQGMFQMSMLYQSYSLMYGSFAIPGVDDAIGLEFIMFGGSDIEGRDVYNQFTGMVQDSKMAFGATYSKRIMRDFYMALKGKFYMRSLGEASDMAMAGDVSMVYNLSDKFTAGINLMNFFGLVMGDTSDRLNPQAMFGIGYKEKNMLFSLDARDNFNEWHFGVEYEPVKNIPLRMGLNNQEISFGGGVRLGIMDADVAYMINDLSNKIAFSVNLNFGRSMDEMTKDQIDQAMADAQEMLNNDYFYLAKQKLEYILSFDPSRKEVTVILERLEKAIQFVESSLPQENLTWEKYKSAKKLFNDGKYMESKKLFLEVQLINQNNRFVSYYLDELSLH